jgi:hypothetical protein
MRKIILEQSNPCLDPQTGLEPDTLWKAKKVGYSEGKPSDYSTAKYCFIIRGGKQLYKSKTGAPPPPPATSSDLEKYVGSYDGEGLLPTFNVILKDGKLYLSGKIGELELTNFSGNKFKGKIDDKEFEINFDVSGDSVTGGTASMPILGITKTIKFTKKSSTPKPEKKEEEKSKPPSPWDCIEKFNKEYNQFKLTDEGDYRYEEVDNQQNGQDTIFMYYKNGDFVWAYENNKKPIMRGKWQCKGDKGYLIRFSDGQVLKYGTKDFELGGKTDANTNTNTNALENPCVDGYKEGCVTENDIFGKGKALKVCSKCDLIKKVQENPEIKARIFRIQKELGQEQKTDNSFGPVMLAAIKEFQQSHGINPTGMVGEKTLSKINPLMANDFYTKRGMKKFESGDKNGGAEDYQKALQILDDGDERDGVMYFMVGVGLKDNKGACSALIKAMERGEIESDAYYDARKCSKIPGFPSYDNFVKLYRTKLAQRVSTNAVEKPKTDGVNNLKTGEEKSNKAEVKPIYRRSLRQVLSPDDEL